MRACLVAAAIAAACPTAGAADRLAMPEDFTTFQRDISPLVTPQLDLPAKTFVQIEPALLKRQDMDWSLEELRAEFRDGWQQLGRRIDLEMQAENIKQHGFTGSNLERLRITKGVTGPK